MDSEAKTFRDSIPDGRCKNCQYADVIRAQTGFMFLGCRHAPYQGERVAEIKECPNCGAKMERNEDGTDL
jgi:ssDNA-binding Zn-finger/Zn-ribbon topoisomerase 1